MTDYVKEYTQMLEDIMVQSQEAVMMNLDLDEKGQEEYTNLIKDNNIVGEIIVNSYKMLMTEDEFETFAKMSVKLRDFIENKSASGEKGFDFIKTATSKVFEKFYEDFSEDIGDIVVNSMLRNNPLPEESEV